MRSEWVTHRRVDCRFGVLGQRREKREKMHQYCGYSVRFSRNVMFRHPMRLSTKRRITTIVIGGGVGPAAGVLLHQKIIEHTNASGDAEHLNVLHASFPREIPDRSTYLSNYTESKGSLSKSVPNMCVKNPGESMAEVLLQFRPSRDDRVIVGVPCNTFHASPIWNVFEETLRTNWPDAVIVHMIHETSSHLKDKTFRIKERVDDERPKVGLLSTTGTRQLRLYHDMLEDELSIVEVDEETQSELHDTIYDPEKGLKAVYPATSLARNNFERYARQLKEKGARAIIMGCTEIPFAFEGAKDFEGIPLLDPAELLSKRLVREAEHGSLARRGAKGQEPLASLLFS